MKHKIGMLCGLTLLVLGLAGCESNSNSSQSKSSSAKVTSSKAVKHHSSKKSSSSNNEEARSDSNSANGKTTTQQISNAGQQNKSQSEINRERGYDPNGNPLLPGQDHAAGSNPDGTPDAWVQGQINEEQFDQQNGLIGPDGRFNDKGKAYYNLPDDFYSGN